MDRRLHAKGASSRAPAVLSLPFKWYVHPSGYQKADEETDTQQIHQILENKYLKIDNLISSAIHFTTPLWQS